MRRTILIAAAVCFVLAALPLLTRAADDTDSLVGKPAPDIALSALDNHKVNLADQKGKVVVADFWATWCPPCRASLPHIQKASANEDWAKNGLVVWAINDRETNDKAAKFLKDNNYTFTVLMDTTGSTLAAYLVQGIPTTVIIGRDGVIKNVFIGFGGETTAKAIDAAVEKALAESAPVK